MTDTATTKPMMTPAEGGITDPSLPTEFLEQVVAQFREPCVVIDVSFPGVRLPAPLRECARDEKVVIDLNAQFFADLRTCSETDGGGFDLVGASACAHIPGGAILCILDRQTGEAFTMRRELLKEPQ